MYAKYCRTQRFRLNFNAAYWRLLLALHVKSQVISILSAAHLARLAGRCHGVDFQEGSHRTQEPLMPQELG